MVVYKTKGLRELVQMSWAGRAMPNLGVGLSGLLRKGRYPKEYKSWIMWEIALPLTFPVIVFLVLLLYWWASHTSQSGAKALISVSGSGDLYVFAAFLLINVGAKVRVLTTRESGRDYFIEGDIDADVLFYFAFLLLLAYMGTRIGLEATTAQEVDTYKFIFGSISVLVVLSVVVWIDSQVCKMYITQLQRRAVDGVISNYYNPS
jgi:hypothetical protein